MSSYRIHTHALYRGSSTRAAESSITIVSRDTAEAWLIRAGADPAEALAAADEGKTFSYRDEQGLLNSLSRVTEQVVPWLTEIQP